MSVRLREASSGASVLDDARMKNFVELGIFVWVKSLS